MSNIFFKDTEENKEKKEEIDKEINAEKNEDNNKTNDTANDNFNVNTEDNTEDNTDEDIFDLDFLSDEPDTDSQSPLKHSADFYKVIVADDDEAVHTVTNMILKNFHFDHKLLNIIDTYSGAETKEALKDNPDTAVILLDVVMEEKDSGLDVVDYLRNELNNNSTRIILRTGQPGQAPEEDVIRSYDINDYKLKTELTNNKLFTSMYSCLRSYRDIMSIQKTKTNLEKMVKASNSIFKQHSLESFLNTIFDQLCLFVTEDADSVQLTMASNVNKNGFIYVKEKSAYKILAASGKYSSYVGEDLDNISNFHNVYEEISHISEDKNVVKVNNGFIFFNKGENGVRNYVYVEVDKEAYNYELIQLFLNNFSLALDNYHLNQMMLKSQNSIIFTLSEVIEKQFGETSNHVRRVSLLMHLMANKLGLSKLECELIRVASALHDIGKIGISESILKKPGKLTSDEFEVIKTHSSIGYDILKNTDHYTFKTAADIALYHHEKYSGNGYPNGLVGDEIPLYARMLAIVDVFDAIISKRCYKDAVPIEDVINIIKSEKGKHFDPMLVDLFLEHIDEVREVYLKYQD